MAFWSATMETERLQKSDELEGTESIPESESDAGSLSESKSSSTDECIEGDQLTSTKPPDTVEQSTASNPPDIIDQSTASNKTKQPITSNLLDSVDNESTLTEDDEAIIEPVLEPVPDEVETLDTDHTTDPQDDREGKVSLYCVLPFL